MNTVTWRRWVGKVGGSRRIHRPLSPLLCWSWPPPVDSVGVGDGDGRSFRHEERQGGLGRGDEHEEKKGKGLQKLHTEGGGISWLNGHGGKGVKGVCGSVGRRHKRDSEPLRQQAVLYLPTLFPVLILPFFD